MSNRLQTITQKVKTPFGSMYIHVDFDHLGRPVGGCISDPGKEPESTVSRLIDDLSEGLGEIFNGRG